MLQDPLVSSNALGRASATVALLCALSSLCCGSMLYLHIVRIKGAVHALDWVSNLQTLSASRWSDPLAALLAPAMLLLWSAASFILALLLAYVFPPHMPDSPGVQDIPRIAAAVALLACTAYTLRVAWVLRRLLPARSANDGVQAADTLARAV